MRCTIDCDKKEYPAIFLGDSIKLPVDFYLGIFLQYPEYPDGIFFLFLPVRY